MKPELIISSLSLIIGLFLLVVHYKNQLERRHGEITKLKSSYLRRIESVHQRFMSIQIHLESTRIALRILCDCHEKFHEIDEVTLMIATMKDNDKNLNDMKNNYYEMNTEKLNKSKTLLLLQATESDIDMLENKVSVVEKSILIVLDHIQNLTIQEKG